MRTPLLPSGSVAEPSDRRVRALVCPPQGVLDVSERMLDSLPEWRMKLGRRVMNEVRPRPPAHQPTAPRTPRHPTHRPAAPQVTRLVVVSWGKASKEKKEAAADKMGLERGA